MSIKHGADDVKKIIHGADEVAKVYHGADVVYENTSVIVTDHVFNDGEIFSTLFSSSGIVSNTESISFLPPDGFKIINAEYISGDITITLFVSNTNGAEFINDDYTYSGFTSWNETSSNAGFNVTSIGSIFYNESILNISDTAIFSSPFSTERIGRHEINPNNLTYRITMESI